MNKQPTRMIDLRPSSRSLLWALVMRAGPIDPDDPDCAVVHVEVLSDDGGPNGHQLLADATGISVKTVQRSLVELEKAGFVVAQQQPSFSYRLHSYTVVIPQEILETIRADIREDQANAKGTHAS